MIEDNEKEKIKRAERRRIDEQLNADKDAIKNRELYLFDDVDEKSAPYLIKNIRTMNRRSKKKDITMFINSGGGCVSNGLAIIDAIHMSSAPIITLVSNEACSMAGIISICGDKRFMTEDSIWMAHDMSGGAHGGDYTTKLVARTEYLVVLRNKLLRIIKEHTALTPKEILEAINGELWLTADKCLSKGIVDEVI